LSARRATSRCSWACRASANRLGDQAAISYLLELGVTAVELLPVYESVPESFLVQRGLTNYWGYNTIGYFAPHHAYSAAVRAGHFGGQVEEFKAMVDALHQAGLEVVLDVVFNHTAEGNQLGPTLCYRAWITRPITVGRCQSALLPGHDGLR
jgi:isoamylase